MESLTFKVGSSGAKFYDHDHEISKTYEAPGLTATAGNVASAAWLHLFEKEKKVLLGDLTNPGDILMQFDLPRDFAPRGVDFLNRSTAPQGVIVGDGLKMEDRTGLSGLLCYDLETGDVISTIITARYDITYRDPFVSYGAHQPLIATDPVFPFIFHLLTIRFVRT